MALVDVLEAVAEQTDLHRYQVKKVLRAFAGEVVRRVSTGEVVRISKFGTFFLQQHAAKVGRNMHTGAQVPIPPRRVLKFRPSDTLKPKFIEIESLPPS